MSPEPELNCRKCGKPKVYMENWSTPRLACTPCMKKSSDDRLGSTPRVRVANCRKCGQPKTLSTYKRRRVWECLPCVRIGSVATRYGISQGEASVLCSVDACQACGGQSVDRRGLHVDHDHETGKVRGVLCDRCNKALGLLDDSCDKITKLASYIKDRS